MPVGTVLASAAVAAPFILPYLEHIVSQCFDDRDTTAMMCTALVPELADGPERDRPDPLQAQRTLTVATSSTSVQVKAIATGAGLRA